MMALVTTFVWFVLFNIAFMRLEKIQKVQLIED